MLQLCRFAIRKVFLRVSYLFSQFLIAWTFNIVEKSLRKVKTGGWEVLSFLRQCSCSRALGKLWNVNNYLLIIILFFYSRAYFYIRGKSIYWIIHGLLNRWTDMSSFLFLTSDQHEVCFLGPKLHPRGGFFGPWFFIIQKKFTSRSIYWGVKLYFEFTRSWSFSCSNITLFWQIT